VYGKQFTAFTEYIPLLVEEEQWSTGMPRCLGRTGGQLPRWTPPWANGPCRWSWTCHQKVCGVWQSSSTLLWWDGEGSEEVHNLISSLADAWLKKVGLQRGRAGSDQELAIITSQLRRRISSATIIANYTLLLETLLCPGSSPIPFGLLRTCGLPYRLACRSNLP
jgi:hypothetical protein